MAAGLHIDFLVNPRLIFNIFTSVSFSGKSNPRVLFFCQSLASETLYTLQNNFSYQIMIIGQTECLIHT